MKKLNVLWLAIAVLAIASCSTVQIDETPILSQKPVKVSFKAKMVDEESTKTIRNTDKSVSWMPGDKIDVFCGTDKGVFTSTNTENALLASFSGELTEATVNAINNGTNELIWALYPHNENATFDGNHVRTVLPRIQTAIAGTFADDLFITLAKSNNLSLSFYNVCSGFKFTVTKPGITSVTIHGKEDETLAGTITLMMDGDGKPVITEHMDISHTVTLIPEKGTFEVGKDYYFVTLPTDFHSGFTVSFETPSEKGVFDVSKEVSFPRSKFVSKANADADVVYQAKPGNITFDDAKFKAYCITNFDTNNDNEISYSEALVPLNMNCAAMGISSLSGIEYFSNLVILYCNENNLSTLDISALSSLQYLFCQSNNLTSLDLSNNINLGYCDCSYNSISTLDMGDCSGLQYLDCMNNSLSSLDVSKHTNMYYLNCSNNNISSLDVSHNLSIKTLYCGANNLDALNISENTLLEKLNCSGNDISTLNLTSHTALNEIKCNNNSLSSLDVSKQTALKTLDCETNQITTLTLNASAPLTDLKCGNNKISSLDVTPYSDLTKLSCYDNYLSSLDVSYNRMLEQLHCDNNSLPSINVSKNLCLRSFSCMGNDAGLIIYIRTGQSFSSFDYDTSAQIVETGTAIPTGNIIFADNNFKSYCVSNFDTDQDGEISYAEALLVTYIWCTNLSISSLSGIEYFENLRTLGCGGNQLATLDLSHNSILTSIFVDNNQLTSLTLSDEAEIKSLSCGHNKLASINIPNGTKLFTLMCGYNSITSLNVSAFPALNQLECNNNLLDGTLDLSSNSSLSILNCETNSLTGLVIGNNIKLSDLRCSNNQLSEIDLSGCRADWLWRIECLNNASGLVIWFKTGETPWTTIYRDEGSQIKYKD